MLYTLKVYFHIYVSYFSSIFLRLDFYLLIFTTVFG